MGRLKGTIAGFAIAVASLLAALPSPAWAQGTLNDMIAARQRAAGRDDSRLLVDAREIVYNNDRNTIAASGDVELSYQGRTLQADRVVYDRNTSRVFAEGNVRLADSSGAVTTASRFELTDDFKTGFIDSLRVVQTTVDRGETVRARFSAPRAERIEGETTTFLRGTYTACEPCRENPERPPLWQVKAARIVHNNQERTIYYENASIEFLGVPIAAVPYFWTPDPTVKRMTGFLAPHFIHSTALGFGVSTPFFWDIAPDRDLTIAPTFYSRQGVLLQAEWRQRLLTGSYNIRAAGIFQQGQSAFLPAPFGPANREGRGMIETNGRFAINPQWQFGWNIALLSDKWFLQNYKIRSETLASNYLLLESTSQVFLRGQGDRSFFDLRGFYFQGLSYADWQKQLPLVAPVLDYDKRIDGPQPLGGELRLQFNFTNLMREAAQFDPITAANRSFPFGSGLTTAAYQSCVVFQRGICLVRGLAGNFARVSGEVSWRRAFVDDVGQVWTPFTYLRADGFFNHVDTTGYQNAMVANFVNPDQEFIGRAMPAVGMEYRYPFVADTGNFGTHTLTPIAQIIARPNETHIGRLPNEDAHSLVYDDTTLFDWDKFSGYDRAEGGVRANLGLQYNWQTPAGWTANALFGQSYQLAGRNSYRIPDLVNTGSESGLQTRASDFVSRFQVNPTQNFSLIARSRFDQGDFSVKSFEAQAVANFNPWAPITGSLTYVRYKEQPALGYLHRREGLQPAAAWNITPNWSIGGSVLFDLDRYLDNRDTFFNAYAAALAQGGQALANTVVYNRGDPYTIAQAGLTLGYKDECTTFSINYAMTPRVAATGERETDRTVLVRLELRTLGQASFSQSLGSTTTDGVSSR
ncbi:LPS-assembly protein LptD [Enterovirga aerilata]|uniref:LPS-assembly protein LptD n=1 Tax=Enterovirga aerilata TaxID=2730920 RepID=A0A849I9D1_9HYPH|nr:LPS-assembly protein LptD [Enterovirga sp. DB1703]NNM72607.1 LPS-assembly protein LptD [Enterovirga sp. DB1703]